MLLFSTVLQINELLTEEIFIQNVIEWNQNSPHQENIIPGIVWDGQESVRFGTDLVWMDITKYDKEEIVAVRYEKIAEDGVIWNSDFVVNFRERKMAIQLDRSYKEEALTADTTFSTPHFITMMIRGGYLVDDSNLAVDTEAFGVCKDHQIMLEALADGDRRYRLPVVFVSKLANGDDPLDVRRLSYRLKGAAHVLTEECTFAQCEGRELACNGDVGIYYPSAAIGYRRFSYKGYTGGSSAGVYVSRVSEGRRVG